MPATVKPQLVKLKCNDLLSINIHEFFVKEAPQILTVMASCLNRLEETFVLQFSFKTKIETSILKIILYTGTDVSFSLKASMIIFLCFLCLL